MFKCYENISLKVFFNEVKWKPDNTKCGQECRGPGTSKHCW